MYGADCTEVALEREVEGDLFLHDIGQGFGFRPGTFDGAIRSVLQFGRRSQTDHPVYQSYNGYVTPTLPLIPPSSVSLDSSLHSTNPSRTLLEPYFNSTPHQTIK